MGVLDDADAVNRHGIALFHLPIRDMSPPGQAFLDAWASRAAELDRFARGSRAFVVHCAAGFGRTGLLCAERLVCTGWSAADASQKLRTVKPGGVETRAQEDHLSAVAR